ncbi:MAG: FAD-dependent oxidoreductase, partial [Pseudomonadota bacterium]
MSTQSSGNSKTKIAILGGGPSGLSTAYHLTNEPDWQDKYEITIYQMGWRVGGKGASGRNVDMAERIEEHGIHLFGNMYANSMRMVQTCLKEVDWEPEEPKALQNMDTAFLPSSFQYMTDIVDGRWERNRTWLASKKGLPWEGAYVASWEELLE